MKNKLIAVILSTTILGGVGSSICSMTANAATRNVNTTESVDMQSNSYNSEKVKLACGNVLPSSKLQSGIKTIFINNKKTTFYWWFGTSQNNNSHNGQGNNGNIAGDNNVEGDNTVNKPSTDKPSTDNKPSNNKPSIGDNNSNNNNNSNNTGEKPSEKPVIPPVVENPSVDETPQVPSVDETPSVDQTPQAPSIDENPSVDNGTSNDQVTNSNFMAQVETAIFNKVNEERAKAGLPALTYNTTMEKYARIKSQDMGDNNYFSHNDLNGNLITTQMKNDGVSYNAWGENIAYIGGSVDANTLATKFMNNWMNSSGHRANILSTNFSSIGVGVYKIGNKYYATQEFYR